MPTLLETWIAVIVIFICGMMIGFEIRRLQDEKKKQSPGLSSPEFLEFNLGHEIKPIINAGGKINSYVEEAYRLHEENFKKRRKAYNYRLHKGRTKKTVYIQCRNGKLVAMKEIYNGKGV